uniref:Sperm surface protein Sp17 n=1 Tax=Lygus hesperus TaxID=30085 RepID=A0A0A9YTP3_LYGHE
MTMNYTLQLHGEKRVYPVPQGLYELLADITREVLRSQPEQIIPFVAEYLSALVITREAAKDAIKIVDEALDDDLMKYCVNLKTTPERVLWAVRVIQKALRRYFSRKFLLKGLKKTCITETLDFVAQKKRNLLLLKKGLLGFKQFTKSDFGPSKDEIDIMANFLQKHNITYLQAHYAAIVMQRAWRGYHTRKTLRVRKVPQVGKDLTEEARPELEKYAPSWANSWLTLFEKAEPPVTPFLKGKTFPVKSPSQVYLPRREITVNRHVLQTLFSGEKDDYDDLCAEVGSNVTSPALSFSPAPPVLVKPEEEYFGEGYGGEYGDTSERDIFLEGAPVSAHSSKKSLKTSSKTSTKTASSMKVSSKEIRFGEPAPLTPQGSYTDKIVMEEAMKDKSLKFAESLERTEHGVEEIPNEPLEDEQMTSFEEDATEGEGTSEMEDEEYDSEMYEEEEIE